MVTSIKEKVSINLIAISTHDGISFLKVSDIIYCESSGNYTTFYMSDGEKILSSKLLKDVEEMLHANSFARVHQRFLVNILYIKKYISQDGGELILTNTARIPVSRFKKCEISGLFGL
jgi:two-component system, LytTR family, response regulator